MAGIIYFKDAVMTADDTNNIGKGSKSRLLVIEIECFALELKEDCIKRYEEKVKCTYCVHNHMVK